MPPYVTMAQMNALIPAKHLIQALDDNKDGVADPTAWDDIVASVQKEIDGLLGVRFDVPFANPVPAMVLSSAEVLAAELLYQRRGFSGEEKNPWAERAKGVRLQLQKVAEGKLPLTPETKRAKPPVSIVAEQAKTTSKAGQTMA